MKGNSDRDLVLIYMFLAGGCAFIGTGLVITTLLVCNYLGVNIVRNFWILGLPVIGSLLINVILIEWIKKIRGH